VTTEQLDLRDQLEVQELLDHQEVVETLDLRELVGHQVVQVQLVPLVSLEVQVQLALLDW
jgi:hypothetical protein